MHDDNPDDNPSESGGQRADSDLDTHLAKDDSKPRPGTLLSAVLPPVGGHLQVLESLGSGGMADVDLALDVGLQRRLAKKSLRSDRHSKQMVCLFLREAQITAQLDHPSIVPVHEVGLDADGHLYFTMKRVEGDTFGTWVKRLPRGPALPKDLQALLEITGKLCDALAFSHSRGVVHGDVKPDNVMVGRFGEVYLMDWGLSRVKPNAATRTSPELREADSRSVGGTPAYMAPEQARGGELDERTDVFAIGALHYFALTRRSPYGGKSVSESLSLARRCDFEPLDAIAREAGIPTELVRIIGRAMAPEPEDRFASVMELREELRTFLLGSAEFPLRDVPAGEHIVREGEVGEEVFILVSGRARAYRTVGGAEQTLREMGPGEVFGEMAILTSSPRTASVVAVEPCVLRVMAQEALEREMLGMKPWAATLTRTLAERLREAEDGPSGS